MKYCPYCGASLVDSAASFCAECGKKIEKTGSSNQEGLSGISTPPPEPVHPASRHDPLPNRLKRILFKKKERYPAVKKRSKPDDEPPTETSPRDEDYDGYYDDVAAADNGHTREKIDPELIKRIVMVGAGALLIVGLSIVIMYIL